MDRHETIDLLQLRSRLTNQRYDPEIVDAWQEELKAVDRGEAVVAMRRACTSHASVALAHFIAELDAHRKAKGTSAPRDMPVCPMCDGSGWREAPDLISDTTYGVGPRKGENIRYTQVEPCSCR